jgi:hypothetical protein
MSGIYPVGALSGRGPDYIAAVKAIVSLKGAAGLRREIQLRI